MHAGAKLKLHSLPSVWYLLAFEFCQSINTLSRKASNSALCIWLYVTRGNKHPTERQYFSWYVWLCSSSSVMDCKCNITGYLFDLCFVQNPDSHCWHFPCRHSMSLRLNSTRNVRMTTWKCMMDPTASLLFLAASVAAKNQMLWWLLLTRCSSGFTRMLLCKEKASRQNTAQVSWSSFWMLQHNEKVSTLDLLSGEARLPKAGSTYWD